jgi:UDP-glucose 4-epimerase
MRVLLIGGNGFIGSHVQDALLQTDHSVRVLDGLPEKYRTPLPGVDYRVGSSADPAALSEALAGVDAVLYLAGTTVPSNANVNRDIQSDLLPLITTLDAMIKAGVERIVFLSSGGTVYGVTERCPVSEIAPTDPISSYGVVKLTSEKYLGMYQHLHAIRPAILRPANIFGPREGHEGVQGFVGTNLLRLLKGEPIEIWGDGSVVRDYLYVEDLARAILLALSTSAVGAMNVGSGESRSLLEVVETMEAVTGEKADVRFLGARAFDVPRLVLDIERARTVLGWQPTVSFQEGVARHWRWLCSQDVQPSRG